MCRNAGTKRCQASPPPTFTPLFVYVGCQLGTACRRSTADGTPGGHPLAHTGRRERAGQAPATSGPEQAPFEIGGSFPGAPPRQCGVERVGVRGAASATWRGSQAALPPLPLSISLAGVISKVVRVTGAAGACRAHRGAGSPGAGWDLRGSRACQNARGACGGPRTPHSHPRACRRASSPLPGTSWRTSRTRCGRPACRRCAWCGCCPRCAR